MKKLHVKKGDTVVLLTGKYNDKYSSNNKRKTGKVLEVSPKEGKVIVEGINFVTKHVKPTRQGQQGGIVKTEAPVYACKVMVVCPKCNKPTRTSKGVGKDGKTVRICKKCNAEF